MKISELITALSTLPSDAEIGIATCDTVMDALELSSFTVEPLGESEVALFTIEHHACRLITDLSFCEFTVHHHKGGDEETFTWETLAADTTLPRSPAEKMEAILSLLSYPEYSAPAFTIRTTPFTPTPHTP